MWFFWFVFFFVVVVAKKAGLLVGIALIEAPCNEPTLISADFPTFLLAWLAWILLLLPSEAVSRPKSIPKPCSLAAWHRAPAVFAAESGQSGTPRALLPLPSSLLGRNEGG